MNNSGLLMLSRDPRIIVGPAFEDEHGEAMFRVTKRGTLSSTVIPMGLTVGKARGMIECWLEDLSL